MIMRQWEHPNLVYKFEMELLKFISDIFDCVLSSHCMLNNFALVNSNLTQLKIETENQQINYKKHLITKNKVKL